MSFTVFTTVDGVHYRHDVEPRSVTLLDGSMRPASATFAPLGDDFDCAACHAAGVFVLTYWRTTDLQVFDLGSGERRASFPYRKVEAPLLDETGRYLLFKTPSQSLLLHLETRKATPILGLRAIGRLVILKGRNEVIVPSAKKGELLRISLETGAVTAISLPIEATFFDLTQNPATRELVLIDRKKGVHCVDPSTAGIVWSVSLKKALGRDHMGVGQFSGDGKLFGAAVSGASNYTVVLDTQKGEVIRRIDHICYGLPWKSALVREASTKRGTFVATALDLSTGEPTEVSLAATGGCLRQI